MKSTDDSLAYTHTLLSFRLPSLSEDDLAFQAVEREEIRSEIGDLVPFLIESKSTVRYTSTREAWTAIWDRIGGQVSFPSRKLLIFRAMSHLIKSCYFDSWRYSAR